MKPNREIAEEVIGKLEFWDDSPEIQKLLRDQAESLVAAGRRLGELEALQSLKGHRAGLSDTCAVMKCDDATCDCGDWQQRIIEIRIYELKREDLNGTDRTD